MTEEDVIKLFKERGALLNGHFRLTSGLHSDSYLQCALLLQYGCDADRLGAELGRRFKMKQKENPITAVVSPAVGGIVLGYVIARPLGARAMFAERVDGKFTLRRGFALAPDEQVLVAEDVLTTGGSVREIAELVQNSGAHVVGIAALADRSESELQFPAPKEALLRQPLVTYSPDNCPLCEQGIPLVKPGESSGKGETMTTLKTRPIVTYKDAGVDVDAGNALVDRIKKLSPVIGGFAGLFPMPKGHKQPMLVGCTDGVGTKLKIAFLADRHDTVGIDLVAMNVNDLLCCGARSLFFLDYFACGKLSINTAEKVIKGIVEGCRQAECQLLGGETAEMPGFYAAGEYDLAGFAVGVVDKAKIIDGRSIKAGDVVLGLPSSGLHSNGYSLVRKVFSEKELTKRWKEFLEPTKIYHDTLKPLLTKSRSVVKAMAHITGGGFIDNVPRFLKKGMQVRVTRGSWPIPELFQEIQHRAQLPDTEMFRTLNMGIGLVMVVAPKDVPIVERAIKTVYRIGVIETGSREIYFA